MFFMYDTVQSNISIAACKADKVYVDARTPNDPILQLFDPQRLRSGITNIAIIYQ